MDSAARRLLRSMGQRLAALRRERGMRQADVAEAVGMLPSNYARIEQGRQNVTIETLVRIGRALDVEVRDMLPARPAKRAAT